MNNGTLFLILLALAVYGLCSGPSSGRSGRTTVGRAVAVRGGRRAHVARHEAGHALAARALGGRVRSARMSDRGGLVKARIPGDPTSVVTFLLAGRAAAGAGDGDHADLAEVDRELRRVPRRDRRRVRREAERNAAAIVRTHRARLDRDARTLEKRGRL